MRVIFRGKDGFEFTEAIENYVNDKLKRISNYFRETDNLESRVVCSIFHDVQTAEITIPTKHIILRAEDSENDLYAAIDLVVDKLERQIRKHKDKINSLYKQREGIANFFKSNEELDIEGLQAEIVGKNLVRNKKIELRPMSGEEASMHMELVDHDFYVYQDKDTNKVCVIYRRSKDNDYAVIEAD